MPNKRAKLSHPSPAHASVSSRENEEVADADDEDVENPEAEVCEDVEKQQVDGNSEQQEVAEQRNSLTDEKHEGADSAEEEEDDDDQEEEDLEREVIEEVVEEEIEEVEVVVEEEEEEVEEEKGGGGETQRGDVEEDQVDADYEEGDESEEVEHEGNLNSGDEDAVDVEEDVDGANESLDEDAVDTNEGAHSASEDMCDEDEDNDVESRKLRTLEVEDDEDEDGGSDENDEDEGDDDDDDDDDDVECRKQQSIEDGVVDSEEDAEDQRRKQLAILMCFSSLQMLITMELCRDTTPPHNNEVCVEHTSTLRGAFLKLMLLAVTSLMQEEGQQCCWKLQPPGQEWTHIARGVSSTDSVTRDSIWRRKYSMSYACFLYLVEELRPFIQSDSQMHVRVPLEIERAVAMVLYRFAHGLSARQVAEKYDVGASTVAKYTLIVASALAEANKLYGRYVAIPTGKRIERIISQFQQITNVSNMCGAIDGIHIKLHFKPEKVNSGSGYRSPNKFESILLQAVCDANKLFWDVCCTAPSGAHDAEHVIPSNLYQNVKDGLSLQEPVLPFENKEIMPYMVGDGAYPIRPFLITPFDTDDPLRRAFDEQLRKGLACINGAFAVLKTRWKISKGMNVHPMHAPRIAVACCVLHNICQQWGEPEPPQQQQMETHSEEQAHRSAATYEVDEAAKMAGEAVREAVFRHWVKRSLENPPVPLDQENMYSGQS